MLWRSRLLQSPSSNPNQNGAKVGSRRRVFLGKLDLSDEVIVGTPKGIKTTRSFRRMTEDRQCNPETLRMFVGVPWNPRGITTNAPGGIRKRYITRALVQAHGATDGCLACQGDGQVHVPRCRKLFEDIFD